MNDFVNVESDTYWLQGWKHLIKTVPASVEQLAHPAPRGAGVYGKEDDPFSRKNGAN